MQAAVPVSRYIVVSESQSRPVLVSAGRFEHTDLETLVEHARQELSSQGINVSRAVLLLPRGNVEVNSLQLPPSSEAELPELVANMLAQKADDASELVASDFLITDESEEETVPDSLTEPEQADLQKLHDVLTFSVPQSTVDDWSRRFKEQNLKLVGITFGGMGAVDLLSQVSTKPARTSLVVTTTDQDTDLAVVENGLPVLFRTIPRATGGERFVTEQLAGEIQRTLALVGHPDDEQTRVYLIGTMDEQESAATQLSDKLSLAVTLVNPFDQLSGDAEVDRRSRFANLIGTACAWNSERIAVDLLNPRKPKPKPSPWGRIGFWATVATLLLAIGGYLLWEKGDVQREEIAQKQIKFERLLKHAKKAQTKVKIVEAVAAWRASEISWLDELDYLSTKLPPASDATIGSLTMVAPGQPGQRGRMDMSVEVSDPSVRLAMEKSLRDLRHTPSSKRVTDASNRANSAWRFQTTVTVAPQPVVLQSPEEPPPTPGTAEQETGNSEVR